MHWATRWRHSVLSAASSPASSQLMPMLFRLRFTMSIQFTLGRPCLVSFQFPLLGVLESSIRRTCHNHLSLLSLIMSSSFRKPVFFLMSSFFTFSFHEILSSLRWNLWWAASSYNFSTALAKTKWFLISDTRALNFYETIETSEQLTN